MPLRELIGPSLEEAKLIYDNRGRDILMTDPRVIKVQTGTRMVRGGYRFVLKAFTGDLRPLERRGLRGQIDGIPVAYVKEDKYTPRALPAFADLDNKN